MRPSDGVDLTTAGPRILDRGDTVFLHARIGHAATIAFYETLGFRPRITPSYVVMDVAS